MPRQRVLVLWVISLLLIFAAFFVAGLLIRNSVAASFVADQHIRNARTLLFDVTKAQLDEETGIRGYLATRDPLFLQPYETARIQLPARFRELQAMAQDLDLPSVSAAVVDAQQTNERWLRLVATSAITHRGQSTLALQKLGKILMDHFRGDMEHIETGLTQRNTYLGYAFETRLGYFSRLFIFAGLLLVVATLAFTMLQTRAWNTLDRERKQGEEARLRESSLRVAYEAEKRIADTLQEAFSQPQLPTIPSMSFSATYMPAAEEAKVGGDWYDAFEIGENRILFTIGDIAGHGLTAAVAMSHVRNSVLSSALLDPNAASILSRVNRQILVGSSGTPMVTAVVGIADAHKYEFTYSAAGHPPPVLIEPGRPPRLLAFGGLPLGVSKHPVYRMHRVQTVPGAMLVLYTDGLIEHSRNIIDGERTLLEVIAAIPDDADAATAIYQSIFHNKTMDDDVAILTIGFAIGHRVRSTISAQSKTSTATVQLDTESSPPTAVLDLLPRIRRKRFTGESMVS